MDLSTLIVILGSTFTIVVSMFGMFLWVRSEANTDRRYFSDIQREDRKDLLEISRNLETLMKGIQNEMKDFHNRLCSIEQGRK